MEGQKSKILSATLKYVDLTESVLFIQEHFVLFYEIEESTGIYFFNKTKQLLLDLKLNISNIKWQGSDDESNIRGKSNKHTCQENPWTFYMPCSCHSVDLVIDGSKVLSIIYFLFYDY